METDTITDYPFNSSRRTNVIRTTLTTLMVLFIALVAVAASAQDSFGPGQGNGVCQFIDEDGDGFNDLAPDADGDGIPNGLDEDYVRPEDGTGNMFRWGKGGIEMLKSFSESADQFMSMTGNRYGLGDGTGSGMGPADGTGFGPGTGSGSGDCTGEGSAEGGSVQQRRGGRR